jgi:hypothetical protein
MFFAPVNKGWWSGEHAQLKMEEARGMEGDDLAKFRKGIEVSNSVQYTYCPGSNAETAEEKEIVAPMFVDCVEYLYDPTGVTVVALRFYKHVFDHSFSLSRLTNNIMRETNTVKTNGMAGAIPESLRKRQQKDVIKRQNEMTSTGNMRENASNQYATIRNVSDLARLYQEYGGGIRGEKRLADFAKFPPNCYLVDLVEDKVCGGVHHYSPEFLLNFKGKYAATAGLIAADGCSIAIHKSQENAAMYYDALGQFSPPQFVIDKGAMHICHTSTRRNMFHAPLPRPMGGNNEPEECLVKLFWEFYPENPAIVAAATDGLDTFEKAKDVVLTQLVNFMTKGNVVADSLRAEIMASRAMTSDSIDADPSYMESGCYNPSADHPVFEPKQELKAISVEICNAHEMIAAWYAASIKNVDDLAYDVEQSDEFAALSEEEAHAQRDEIDQLRSDVQERHSDVTDALIRLALKRFAHAFSSKELSKTIAPGWRDVWKGTLEAFKATAERGNRKVNPKYATAADGTANLAFAYDIEMSAKDVSPAGQWRAWLMNMLSEGASINGPDVRIMQEAYQHAFEPFQELSFYFLVCGGAGIGKSLRAQRMEKLMCPGWICKSGPGSAKAGQNGGMDHTCGRMMYYDEMFEEYGSNNAERLEYLKRISMDQQYAITRTTKVQGKNGNETYQTTLLNTVHYETSWISTNCGPCGIKGEQEPNDNRKPLLDRSFAQMAFGSNDADKQEKVSSEEQFEAKLSDPAFKIRVNQLRVISGLNAMVQIVVKHIPFCTPDLSYATMLMSKWDSHMWRTFNLPIPSSRKKNKRNMVLRTLAYEAAIVDKFYVGESAAAYGDMLPDAENMLTPFSFDQLVDVIRGAGASLDHETILLAWSFSLDHSPATSAHVFHLKTLLAQMHGNDLEFSTFSDFGLAAPAPAPGDETPAGVAPQPQPQPQPQQEREARENSRHGTNEGDPIIAPRSRDHGQGKVSGQAACSRVVLKGMMSAGMSRDACRSFASKLATQRAYRQECSARLLSSPVRANHHARPFQHICRLMSDEEVNGVAYYSCPQTGKRVEATRAAGAVMPTAQEVLNSGYSESFLRSIVEGNESDCFGRQDPQTGLQPNMRWAYHCINSDDGETSGGPAEYDLFWAQPRQHGRKSKDDDANSQGKTRFSAATEVAMRMGNDGSKAGVFNPMRLFGITPVSVRDITYLLYMDTPENLMRIPVQRLDHMRTDYKEHARMRQYISEDQMDAHILGQDRPRSIHPCGSIDLAREAQCNGLQAIPRPVDTVVSDSRPQRVLDALTLQQSLPACDPSTCFELGSPIRFRGQDAMQFNKGIGSLHTMLTLESSAYLSTKPGIFQRPNLGLQKVPDSFRAQVVHCDRTASNDASNLPAALHFAVENPGRTSDENGNGNGTGTGTENGSLVAAPGVTQRAQNQDQIGGSQIKSMTYTWHMLASYLTDVMGMTLCNDCKDQVQHTRNEHPDVYGYEAEAETLRDLPHLMSRFPGSLGRSLYPLSIRTPQVETSVSLIEGETGARSAGAATGCSPKHAAAVLTHELGRTILPDDAEVHEFMSRNNGGISGSKVTGNIFLRSTWLKFTRESLERRGMLRATGEECNRVADKGLYLLNRLRNAKAVSKQPGYDVLVRNRAARCQTWEALERAEHELASPAASAGRRATQASADEASKKRKFQIDKARARIEAGTKKNARLSIPVRPTAPATAPSALNPFVGADVTPMQE